MSSKSYFPLLRFLEFKENWKQVILKDVSTYSNGGSYESSVKNEGNFELITLKSIDMSGNLVNSKRYIDDEVTTLTKGTLVMILSEQSPGLLGMTAVIPIDNKFVLNQRVAEIRPNQKVESYFLSMLINKNQRYFSKHGAGTKVQNISKPNVEKFEFLLPSLPEQQKIASFLISVDDKINLLSKKKELLEQYKKGVMQKIFSQEIRFKDDNGNDFPDWEEKKLVYLCDIRTGKLDANAMSNTGNYRFYTCAKDYYHIDSYAFDTNALIISGNGANVGYIHHYEGKFNAYQRTYVLDDFKDDIIFIKFFLEKHLYKRIYREKKDGATPYITLSTLTDMNISIPQLKEQIKISSFLSSIDKKIGLVDSQIDKTKDFKKGLLQKMLV